MMLTIPAVEKCIQKWLLPEESVWNENAIPLEHRGVRFGWLYNFLSEVWETTDAVVAKMWEQYREDEMWLAGSRSGPARQPIYPKDLIKSLCTTRQLVCNLIVPITSSIKAPLYARIPPEHRGRPSVFISHTWSSCAFAGGHGSLDIILDHYSDTFVWLDIACYNQHLVLEQSIAADMESIISAIGRIALILTTEPFFTRSWCLWELVCGHLRHTDLKVHDQIARIKKKYFSSEASQLPPNFTSVAELSAFEASDQEQIFQLLLSTFGSVQQADEFVRGVLPERW